MQKKTGQILTLKSLQTQSEIVWEILEVKQYG